MSARMLLARRPAARPLIFAACLVALLLPATMAADEEIGKGAAIAREAERRDSGWGNSEEQVVMVLEDLEGNRRERRLHIFSLEEPAEDEGDKSLVVFDEPRDIEGTALLSHSHVDEPDDQWLFLPALKRVKRISSANKKGSFVGSEFAYEDITGQEFGKYSYTWLRDESCGDLQCHVIERRPQYEDSGYLRLVTWYDTQDLRIQRVDYYGNDGELLKTLTLDEYRLYGDRHWRPHRLTMESDLTGKQTELVYEKYEFNTGLTERDFDQGALRRIR